MRIKCEERAAFVLPPVLSNVWTSDFAGFKMGMYKDSLCAYAHTITSSFILNWQSYVVNYVTFILSFPHTSKSAIVTYRYKYHDWFSYAPIQNDKAAPLLFHKIIFLWPLPRKLLQLLKWNNCFYIFRGPDKLFLQLIRFERAADTDSWFGWRWENYDTL